MEESKYTVGVPSTQRRRQRTQRAVDDFNALELSHVRIFSAQRSAAEGGSPARRPDTSIAHARVAVPPLGGH